MDSTCDLTPEQIARFEVSEILPLDITMGKDSFKDKNFRIQDIYEFVKNTKQLPKTSAVNEYDFSKAFSNLTADGSAVLHFSISSELSVSCANARAAAEKCKDVYVIDGRQLSTGTSLLLIYARNLLEKNPEMTAREAADILNTQGENVQTSFVVDTIDYLYKGGRCSALSLFGANLLRLHPSLHLKGGQITVGRKYRGKMKKIFAKYIEDLREDNPDYDNTICFITYTVDTDPSLIAEAERATREFFDFKEILFAKAGATITCHCGKGTLGLLFLRK